MAAKLADFHVSDDGVGGKCATKMKRGRVLVGGSRPLFLMVGGVAPDGFRELTG